MEIPPTTPKKNSPTQQQQKPNSAKSWISQQERKTEE